SSLHPVRAASNGLPVTPHPVSSARAGNAGGGGALASGAGGASTGAEGAMAGGVGGALGGVGGRGGAPQGQTATWSAAAPVQTNRFIPARHASSHRAA